MNKFKLTAGILLIFILGGLTGALAVQLYYRHDFRDGPPRHRTPAERTDFIMGRLTDDLDLNDQQAAEIRPIVEANEKAVSELRDRIDPEMRQVMDQGFADIREKLDVEQQKKLDELKEKLKSFRRKKEEKK